jgi:Na+-translocating ferredoxin:NAD+ oxidoreductase RnfG subunit
MDVIIAIIVCVAVLILAGIISFTSYKCAIQENRVKVETLQARLFSQDEVLRNKENECNRLSRILEEVFEKTSKVSVDAQLKS